MGQANIKWQEVVCKNCGKAFKKKPKKKTLFCSPACSQQYRKEEKHPSWKGDKRINYQVVKCPKEFKEMAFANGNVRLHRLVMAQKIGRPLQKKEVVHHLDENIQNNAPENLELFETNSSHRSKHMEAIKLKTKGAKVSVKCPQEFQQMSWGENRVYLHRLVVAKALKRCLNSKEIVGHKDFNLCNNSLENLLLFENTKEYRRYLETSDRGQKE